MIVILIKVRTANSKLTLRFEFDVTNIIQSDLDVEIIDESKQGRGYLNMGEGYIWNSSSGLEHDSGAGVG